MLLSSHDSVFGRLLLDAYLHEDLGRQEGCLSFAMLTDYCYSVVGRCTLLCGREEDSLPTSSGRFFGEDSHFQEAEIMI